MTPKQKKALKDAAKEKYNGDLDVAIAASIMGDEVIARAGNQVPAGADLERIADIRRVVDGKQKKVTPYVAPGDSPEYLRRPDHLNADSEMPEGDPPRPDSKNKKRVAGDPERTDASPAGRKPEPDAERPDEKNVELPIADDVRADDANGVLPSGDPARPDNANEA